MTHERPADMSRDMEDIRNYFLPSEISTTQIPETPLTDERIQELYVTSWNAVHSALFPDDTDAPESLPDEITLFFENSIFDAEIEQLLTDNYVPNAPGIDIQVAETGKSQLRQMFFRFWEKFESDEDLREYTRFASVVYAARTTNGPPKTVDKTGIHDPTLEPTVRRLKALCDLIYGRSSEQPYITTDRLLENLALSAIKAYNNPNRQIDRGSFDKLKKILNGDDEII